MKNLTCRPAVIYARVSAQKQDYQRQISELHQYAGKNDIQVVKIFSERISGTKLDFSFF